MDRRRITALVAAFALFAFLIPMAGTALAWGQPTITAVCSPSPDSVHNWTVTLDAGELNYDMQYSWSSNFTAGQTTAVTMHAGDNSLSTVDWTELYVRWASDLTTVGHATWDSGACPTPTLPPATPTLPPATATLPAATPSPSPIATATATATVIPTATATVTPTAKATATATGHGAAPTAMPKSTTGGSDGSSGFGSILLIGFLLLAGGLGFAAIRRLETRRLS